MKKTAIVFTTMLFLILVSCAFNVKTGLTKKDNIKAVGIKNISLRMDSNRKQFKPKPSRSYRKTRVLNNENVIYSNKAVVLTYHHISNLPYSDITIKPERFESDLKMLVEKGFNVISLREMLNAIDGKAIMPNNAVVITFDDGLESFYKYAYPLLKKYNMTATNFVITTRNESYKPSTNDTNPLSPAEISEMYSSGLIDIQSHSNDSHELVYINSELKKGSKLANRIYDNVTKTMESPDEYDKRVLADLAKSRELIYKYTNQYSDVLCFPFGVFNQHLIELAKQSGFKYFVTTEQGTNKEGSNRNMILRIRSGDKKLDTEKLYNSILNITNRKKAR
jgi:peptidoglycan/xylan/chitin deacetylase (PgdA/CDA1 family)